MPFVPVDSVVAWYQEKWSMLEEMGCGKECSIAIVALDSLDGWYRGWM